MQSPKKLAQRSLSTILSLSTCLLAVAVPMPGQAQSRETSSPNAYPEEVVKIFVDSCVSGGGKSVPPEVMKQICSCSIEGIQTQYTLNEFVKLRGLRRNNLPVTVENRMRGSTRFCS
jgi:hypothetical protein